MTRRQYESIERQRARNRLRHVAKRAARLEELDQLGDFTMAGMAAARALAERWLPEGEADDIVMSEMGAAPREDNDYD